jgi:miniconductance mechanosensitive channel
MDAFLLKIQQMLLNNGVGEGLADFLLIVGLFVVIALISWLADMVTKKVLIRYFVRFARKTQNKWDDILAEKKLLIRFAHFVPAIIVYNSLKIPLGNHTFWLHFTQNIVFIYMVVLGLMLIIEFLSAVNDIYNHNEFAKDRPIKGYLQLVNIIFGIVGAILIFSKLFDYPPYKILTGLGAMAAVLILVFKDTILGLTASIQLTANKMLKIGDWISMPSHNADGTVMEVTLNTVKIQNWDKTITTVPTYALVSSPFANWRGMEESGGRRIKRAINLDMRSVKFCDAEMLERFKNIRFISQYIQDKVEELSKHNKEQDIDEEDLLNARRLTNIGTFRHYVKAYLQNHPQIKKDMTFLVRQLQPTDKGIPIEIYVFSADQRWAFYEDIQADIFDHIMAIIPAFDLQVFQNPTGADFEKLK